MKRSGWLSALRMDWQHIGLMFMLGIFLYQYVVWFDTFWVNETRPIVELSMLVTFIIEIIPRVHVAVRRIVQLALIAAVNARILEIKPVYVNPDLSFVWKWISLFYWKFQQLMPFIWYGVGVWFIYLFMIWWITTKTRILFMIGFSVVAFSVIDSFSSFYLWPQVAWFIGSGMMILVIRNFGSVKKRHPQGWETFSEYPVTTVAFIATILTITISLGVLAPDIRPIVKDPYTIWKTAKGEAIPLFGKTRIIEVPGLESSSGYSRNDSSLGGGFNFDYTPVFTVDASHRSYWRGETRSLYTGGGWEQSNEEKKSLLTTVPEDRPLPVDSRRVPGKLKTVEVTQTFKMLTDQAYPVLFGAYSIQKISHAKQADKADAQAAVNVSFDEARWSPVQSSVRWIERGTPNYPKTYTVTSLMPVVNADALRTASVPAAPAGLQDYLQLPAELPPRVKQFAADVTASAKTPYDKVKALETYLSTHYKYNNKPDISEGQSKDFVDRFLFEVQEGYCDYFSTSLVVLSRSLGMPARWVKGYAPGQAPIDPSQLNYLPEGVTDSSGPAVYTVRNSDAHSWAEVYFEGYGWIPFEATPGFVMPAVTPEENQTLPEVSPNLPEVSPKVDDVGTVFPWVRSGAIAVIAVTVLALGWWLQRRFRWIQRVLPGRRFAQANVDYSRRLVADFEKFLRFCKRKGLPWNDYDTARETAGRWKKQYSYLSVELDPLLFLFEKAKYSRSEITESDFKQAEQSIRKLRQQVQ